MATYTATGRSKHATLAAGVADVVTLDAGYPYVQVESRDTNDLYFTVDLGPAGNQTTVTPTVAGDGTYHVGPGGVFVARDDNAQLSGSLSVPSTTVRIVSSAAAAYTVTGLNP